MTLSGAVRQMSAGPAAWPEEPGRGTRGSSWARSAGGSQVPRGGDDRLAGDHLAQGALDPRVAERGGLQFALDLAGQGVPDPLQPGQRLVGADVGLISLAGALDGGGGRLERGGAELANARVQLLVAGPERVHP